MPRTDFTLLSPLGANELCLRYLAQDAQRCLVEICVLRGALGERSRVDNGQANDPFIARRIQLVRRLEHAAIQRIVEVDDSDKPYVILQHLPGPMLADCHSKKPLTAIESLQLGLLLADGLTAAHRLGLLHGHLAPRSIRSMARGQWCIDVTGLTRDVVASEHDPDETFLAPEVLVSSAETASDVYGLAAILRWLVSTSEADPFKQTLPQWPKFLHECLNEDPASRPSMSEMSQQFAILLPELLPAASATMETRAVPSVRPVAADQTMVWDATKPPVPTSLGTGQQLGPYEILSKLGEGGMGAVYRARDLGDDSTVALKVVRDSFGRDAEARRRFAKEARLLARANNPYVANLLGFNDEPGLNYLAVEFVAGGTLEEWLQEHGRCTEASALAIIADAARGLFVAHQRGIVHRDIKPANLLLTHEGAEFLRAAPPTVPAGMVLAKLSDFGLARTEQQTESLAITYAGAVLGTPYYMSPEQCRGGMVDGRSDIYSLGATLFHLLVGEPPFKGTTHVAVMNQHCHDPPPALRKLRPELSEAVDGVVAKCLAKNPDARYAHAGELLNDVTSILAGSPTSIGVHPPLPSSSNSDVMSFHFTWELQSSPAKLWPYVSNTDRVNRALGLPAVRFTNRIDRGGVRRFAEAAVAGQRLDWEEHPYEWIEGRRMSVLREFTRGPFRWFVSIVELQPRAGGGSILSQTLKVLPRNMLGRALAYYEIGVKSKRSLTRVYQQVDEYVSSGARHDPARDAFRKAAELPHTRRARLAQRLGALRNRAEPDVLETLGQFLAHASDQEVSRIRPLSFAERFRLDPNEVVTACLWGAREGLLLMLWDIVCPSCRIPADVKETIAAFQDHGHCEACNVDFELDFSNSIELIFRAHPEIRDAETRTYCIGGPAFSAHVVSQVRLAPGERFEMELALNEGAYRVRGPQLPFVVDLRVASLGSIGRWELPLSRPPSRETIPLLKPDGQLITLHNDTQREVLVRLERTASRTDAFTAARASALALFRELFPGEILSPGQIVSVTSLTLLLVQAFESAKLYAQCGDAAAFETVRRALGRIQSAVNERDGAVVKTEGDGLLAAFSDTNAAVQAALHLISAKVIDSDTPLQLAIHRGPAMVTTINDRLDYFGNAVHTLRQMLSRAGANELLLTDAVAGIPEIISLLRAERCVLDVLPNDNANAASIVHRCRK